MIPDELKPILIELIGRHAFNNNLKINPDFANLMGALEYLIIQMPIALRNSEQEDKDYGKLLITTVKEMLESNEPRN
jgi:hypothetical protein